MEAHLGPQQPRWAPKTEDDIRVAVDSGLIKESHYIDAKGGTGDTQSERKETARHLASYAIDGGALLFGVSEDKQSHAMHPDPLPLNGLVEKIDNIAAMLCRSAADRVGLGNAMQCLSCALRLLVGRG